MAQYGFSDAERRLNLLSEKGDPLEAIERLVPWESFRADIEAMVLRPNEARKSLAGRKPIDAIVMFRMLVLQSLYNLSDEQFEYQVRDWLSFTRLSVSGSRIAFPTAPHCGCSARSWRVVREDFRSRGFSDQNGRIEVIDFAEKCGFGW